jgi:dihydrodipicolinate synthase/N-acetylneuraminate lyase
MPINLSGLLLPITTPFTANGEVEFAALQLNIERWNLTGITGYVVLGSTGERVNLNEGEFLQVIEVTRKAVPRTMTFIVGAGQQSTRGTISEIERAATSGADAVLVITPSFYRSAISQAALIDYYSAVADAAKIPVLLYSMPDLTGIVIEPETAAKLSQHPNIIGMKDSSNDIERFSRTVQIVEQHFAMMIGNGTVFSEALQAGARAGILAVGCCAPQICLDIYQAIQGGSFDLANALQEKLTPLARAVTKTYGIGGLKAALEMVGYAGGAVRAPLRAAGEIGCEEIQTLLRDTQQLSVPGAVSVG